ncbi:MAG: GNAT family N-acetyltransferase [Devosia sp.]
MIATIRIIPQQGGHAEGLYQALLDPRIYACLEGAPPLSVDAMRERIARQRRGAPADSGQRWLNWSVFRSNNIVGYTQATILGPTLASIAYVFTPAVWGTGLAQTAVELMIAELAERHGVQQLIADTAAGNLASQGLLARLGFAEQRRSGGDIHYTRTI